MPGGRLPGEQRTRLVRWMKGMELQIKGHRGMAEAIVTAGGVALDEVQPETMESRLVPGLFMAGEVLDVAADTGGYNLQAAFSTGVLAGRSAAAFSQCGSDSPRS
jgi:predicted flavoprotein YhiN